MTIHPNHFYKILSLSSPETSPLHSEVTDLCRLSEAQYNAIYQTLSTYDQCVIDDRIKDTNECVRKLTALREVGVTKAPEVRRLRDLAVDNLLVIRNYQNILQLAARFPEQKDFFMAFKAARYHDVVSKVVIINDRLPTFSHCQLAINILYQLGPQERQEALAPLATLLGMCHDLAQRDIISHFLIGVQNKVLFLKNLAKLLTHAPQDAWGDLLHNLGDEKELLVNRLAPFLRPQFDFAAVLRLLDVIREFRGNPQAIDAALPLMNLCGDGQSVDRVVRDVATTPAPLRNIGVQRVVARFHGLLPSELVRNHFMFEVAEQLRPLFQLLENMHIHEDEHDFYVDRTDFRIHPEKVLRNFVEFLSEHTPNSFTVKFLNEQAVDAGGPGKEFLFKLVNAIAERFFVLCANGLYRPQMAKFPEQVLKDLGQLFMFTLHSSDYRIGMQFDRSLFVALMLLKREHVSLDLSTFNAELFAIYEQMKAHSEDDVLSIKRMKPLLAAGNQEALEVATENVQLALAPCMAIWNGMKESKYVMPVFASVDELDAYIQGTVTPSQLVSMIQFDKTVFDVKQKWIKNWISSMDLFKMKKFLYFVTGTAGLGTKKIIIEVGGQLIKSATCFHILRMPDYASEEQMVKELEDALANEESFSCR